MGRHSSPEQGHFYRSFAGWVIVWVAIAAVAGVAVWFLVTELGGPDVTQPLAGERDRKRTEMADPEPTVSGARVVAIETPQVTPTPAITETPSEDVELITEGITVQVLNATQVDSAGQTMSSTLADLGFAIIAVEESSQPYELTTVFWSSEASRDAAVALAEKNGWVAEAKPGNLSDEVSIHVVVGSDEV